MNRRLNRRRRKRIAARQRLLKLRSIKRYSSRNGKFQCFNNFFVCTLVRLVFRTQDVGSQRLCWNVFGDKYTRCKQGQVAASSSSPVKQLISVVMAQLKCICFRLISHKGWNSHVDRRHHRLQRCVVDIVVISSVFE
jgi:hypothetical protein